MAIREGILSSDYIIPQSCFLIYLFIDRHYIFYMNTFVKWKQNHSYFLHLFWYFVLKFLDYPLYLCSLMTIVFFWQYWSDFHRRSTGWLVCPLVLWSMPHLLFSNQILCGSLWNIITSKGRVNWYIKMIANSRRKLWW